jgi:hypothetical protein
LNPARDAKPAKSQPFKVGPQSSDAANRAGLRRTEEALAKVACESPTPRQLLLTALTTALTEATMAGDIHAARVAHEAIGKLLTDGTGQAAPVADLALERAKHQCRQQGR